MIKYVSVAEYARMKSISLQAVYKQINKKTVEYRIEDKNGKQKYLIKVNDNQLVEQPIKPEVEQPVKPEKCDECVIVEQDTGKCSTTKLNPVEQPIKPDKAENETEFQLVIRILQEQLAEKDKQIERLQEQNARQAEENRVKDTTIKEALEKAQTLQAQVNLLLLESKKPEEPEPEDIVETTETPAQPKTKKSSFWHRFWFGE